MNNERYIRQRKDGSWETRMIESVDKDGKSIRKSHYFSSRQDAREYVRKAIRKDPVKDSGFTFGDWMKKCMDDMQERVQPYTVSSWRNTYLTAVQSNPLERIKINKMKRDDIVRWAGSVRKKNGEPYPLSSMKTMLYHISRALSLAEQGGLIEHINVRGILQPDTGRVRQEKVLTPEDAGRIIKASEGSRIHNALIVALYTGLRRSELLALKWEDLDMDTGEYIVRRKVGKGNILSDVLKTQASYRTGMLSEKALQAVRDQKAQNARERLKAGPVYKDMNLVFPNTIGGVQSMVTFGKSLSQISEETIGRSVGLHAFRHMYATLLIRQHVDDLSISSAMGHASANFTRQRYADYYDDAKAIASRAIAKAVDQEGIL